jgi:hypothetical protein
MEGREATALNTRAGTYTETIRFGIGVISSGSPKPIKWNTAYSVGNAGYNGSKPLIITNATDSIRKYRGNITSRSALINNGSYYLSASTSIISLSPGASCYLDEFMPDDPLPSDYEPIYIIDKYDGANSGRYFSDVTDPNNVIFNAPYQTGDNNISTCSAKGIGECASNKWSSWTVALANLSANDMPGGVGSGQTETLRNNSWNNGAFIYYEGAWSGTPSS